MCQMYRVIELKGMIKLEKENNDENLYELMKKERKREASSSSKSKKQHHSKERVTATAH